jgi:HK97 family phage major capsid protein
VLDDKLNKISVALDELAEAKKAMELIEKRRARPGYGAANDEQRSSPEAQEHRTALLNWVRNPSDPENYKALKDATKAYENRTGDADWEKRSVQTMTTTGVAGGFAVPEEIAREIDRLSVDISPLRQISKVITVGSTDYKELLDVGGSGFEWVGEGDPRNQTDTPNLAEVAPTFGMAAAKPQASEESLDDLFFDVSSWLIESASEALAYGEGAAFISGNGTKKPTGILAGPAPVGNDDASRTFGTLQYIASGQAAALPENPDKFFDMIYGLRARYRGNAQWLTSKAVLAQLRKYKDTTNAYLWQPSLVLGQPDMFMGYAVTEAEDMPGVAANAFPLAFGDFRQGYLIADRVGMRITRDDITVPGFVKFYIRKRVGGKLRNTQAIKLLKIAAA